MKRIHILAPILAAFAMGGLTACDDGAENAGEAIDESIDNASDAIDDAADDAGDALEDAGN